MNLHTCKNCGIKFYGAYCNNCGQKHNVGRLTWPSWLENIMYGITNIEYGILFTIKELFTRPGYMMRDYLEGKRIKYFKPFSMLFVLAAIYTILITVVFPDPSSKFKQDIADQVSYEMILDEIAAEVAEAEDDSEVLGSIGGRDYSVGDLKQDIGAVQKSVSVVILIVKEMMDRPGALSIYLLFSFALATRWIFRKNGARRYNYVEFLFIGAYMVCQRFLVDIVLVPYEYFWPEYDGFLDHSQLIFFSYVGLTAWDYKQFFGMRWRAAVWKTLKLYLLSFVLAVGIAVLIFTLIILFAYLLGKG